ncbi:MAG: hypothetical protein GY868_13760, partial [Deltaproteobacteria bacterium]|nr:hypothetical protein [Deltaproteobacteria bacterium]
ELRGRKKRLLHFGRIIQLAEGSNRITVEAVDGRGRPGKQVVTLVRKTPRARQIGSRLTLSVYPFAETIKSAEPLERYVQSSLIHAFVNQERFNILERHKLERLLQEQKISRSAVFDQDQAVSLGRLMAAETILLGDLFVKDGSVEVIARMVDTGSSLVLAEKDAYWEAGTAAGLRETLDGLALKFKQHFPLCEGEVIDRKDGAVFVNLGTRNAVSSGMRLLSFKENGAVTNRITGAAVGSDTTITGLLTTEEVHEAFSKTTVVKRFTADRIVVGDKVITK